MIKIFIQKNDEVASVAEQVITSPDSELVVVVPRFSKLAESASNFELLRREAEAVGKALLVESVDERALSLAKASHLEAINPFFEQVAQRREMSDIVRPGRGKTKVKIEEEDKETRDVGKEPREAMRGEEKMSRYEMPKTTREALPPKRRWFSRKKLMYFGFFLSLLGGGMYAALFILPKAEVVLVSKKSDWEYGGSVLADKAGSQVTGQVFSKEQNQSFSFPASGKKAVERKAKGIITIYNAFSSSPQYLVATTRFMTPEGKLYRLDKGVTVPGAKVTGGTIEPSSIDAEISADKAGAEYNTGPVSKLSIPGFQGTPRYDGFYGELKNGASGGVVGEVLFPTSDDIAKAKESSRASLEKSLETFLLAQVDAEFRVVPGASRFVIEKENVVEEVAADGKFSVFLQARADVMAFRESDMVRYLEMKAQGDIGKEYKIKNYDLKFQNASADFASQTMSIPVQFKATFAHQIDISDFKSLAAGRAEQDLKTLIFGIPGVQSATVNLWPFWVYKVPSDTEKISVAVE